MRLHWKNCLWVAGLVLAATGCEKADDLRGNYTGNARILHYTLPYTIDPIFDTTLLNIAVQVSTGTDVEAIRADSPLGHYLAVSFKEGAVVRSFTVNVLGDQFNHVVESTQGDRSTTHLYGSFSNGELSLLQDRVVHSTGLHEIIELKAKR